MPSALLSDRLREQLRGELGELPESVEMQLVLRGSAADQQLRESQQMVREVAEELVAAAPDRVRLSLADLDGGDPVSGVGERLGQQEGVPVLQLSAPGSTPRIAYLGIPGGHEFGALVDTVRRLGERSHGMSDANVRRLGELRSPVEVMVFVTPSCPYCPGAASLAFRMAMASPMVTGITVEAMEFPALSDRHQVSGVPRTVVNGAGAFVGAVPEDRFVSEVLRLAEAHPLVAR